MPNKNRFRGGLVCALPYRNESHFSLFMRMLNNPTCKISEISYKSLYGFIFRLEIDKPIDPMDEQTIVPFLKLNSEKTQYDVPVYSIVIKLVLLNDPASGLESMLLTNYKLYEWMNIFKKTTTVNEFAEEIKTQSEVYKNTMLSGQPICPSIVSSAYLKANIAESLLTIMRNKADKKDASLSMLNYISQEINKSNKNVMLGVIAMESVTEYTTVYKYLFQIESTMVGSLGSIFIKSPKEEILLKILFLVLRMYYETGYIHCDLHQNNAMIKRDNKKKTDIQLIDFGIKIGDGIPKYTKYDDIIRGYGEMTEEDIEDDLHSIGIEEEQYSVSAGREPYSRIFNYMVTYNKYKTKDFGKLYKNLCELFHNFSIKYLSNEEIQRDMKDYAHCYKTIKPVDVNINDLVSKVEEARSGGKNTRNLRKRIRKSLKRNKK
jgi:hypothetical protein